MAGLSDLITNTANQTTTMPSWYDTAQQNIVNQAGAASGNMPSLQNTVAGTAINNLSGPNNPFTQAQGSLNQIATGAANPWITDASGNVTPDTSTAMGGLFQAQNQQLNQLMPNYTAAPTAAGIGSGQFGSLRNQTAVDKSMADAQANLFAQQNQAALQNQQTGVSAATGLGSVGAQGTTAETTLGQAQQSDPFTAAANYGKIVGGITAPTTVANRTQLSPLNTVGSLASAGSGILNSLFGTAAVPGGAAAIPGLISNSGIADWFKTYGANNTMSGVNNGTIDPTAGATTSGGALPGQTVDDYGNPLPQ